MSAFSIEQGTFTSYPISAILILYISLSLRNIYVSLPCPPLLSPFSLFPLPLSLLLLFLLILFIR